MFNFTIKVFSKSGELKRSFGLYTKREFDKKIKRLIGKGAAISTQTDFYATLVM